MAENKKKYVYCSGPLFCPEEIRTMTKIAKVLENEGYGTFLPHRDGLETYIMKYVNDPRIKNKILQKVSNFIDKAIFALDIYQIIERCDYLVFNMNGRVPDEGGVVETAIAFAAGKPLVIYKNDKRTKFNGNDNSMITGLSYTFSKINAVKKIPAELNKVINKVQAKGKSPYKNANIPPFMRDVINLGSEMWKLLNVINCFNPKEDNYYNKLLKIEEMCKKF